MATSNQPIYDRASGALVGYTGAVPGAIYGPGGAITGFMSTSHTLVKPSSRSTTTATTTFTPSSTPFRQTTSVVGTEDVRNLPYGTESVNRPATVPTQPQTAVPSTGPFDVQGYVNNLFQQWIASQQQATGPTSPQEVRDWIYKHYGYMAAYINHPEIGPILMQAARDGVTGEAELFGRLSGTNWWQTTSASARQWDYLRNVDPAEADRQVAGRVAEIVNRAETLGISGLDHNDLAERTLRAGWSADQIVDYLVSQTKGTTAYTSGQLGALQQQVRNLASQYMIDVSDLTSSNYARRMASDELTLEGASAVFLQQARQRFPWMNEILDKGTTPADYFMPLRDQLAQSLEVTPDSIDIMDPKWLSLMEVTDAKSGERRGATGYELLRTARGLPDWWKTDQSQELMAGLTVGLARQFGMV